MPLRLRGDGRVSLFLPPLMILETASCPRAILLRRAGESLNRQHTARSEDFDAEKALARIEVEIDCRTVEMNIANHGLGDLAATNFVGHIYVGRVRNLVVGQS